MDEDLNNDLVLARRHEELLVFPSFDESDAWQLGQSLRASAQQLGASVAIDIRRGDDCLFFTAMPGTTPANADWARRKRNLVNLLQSSSYVNGLLIRLGTVNPEFMALPTRDFAWAGGCFPIRVTGSGVVGTITVSGLPQREDHKLVVDTISDYLGVDLGDSAF
jgi:uncharacterized protein (UPF0303 family)